MVVGLLGNESPDSNRFTLVTPKSENDVRLQATLGNQNPTGLPVGAVSRDALADVLESQNNSVNVGENVGTNVGINVGTNEDKILALLRQDPKLTAKTLAFTLGLTERQVERILSKLKRDGHLLRHGASKNGYWEVR